MFFIFFFFFSSRRRHTRCSRDWSSSCSFFFQAEDGIRDVAVTGVQTCALPIYRRVLGRQAPGRRAALAEPGGGHAPPLHGGGRTRLRRRASAPQPGRGPARRRSAGGVRRRRGSPSRGGPHPGGLPRRLWHQGGVGVRELVNGGACALETPLG